MLNVMACLIIPLASLHDDLVLLSSNLRKKIFILNFAAFTNSLWKPLSDFLEHYYVISFYKSRLCCLFLRFWSSLSFLYRYFSSGVLSQGHTCASFQSSLPSIFLLIVLLFPLYPWVMTFSLCCDKVSNKSNWKEGRVCLSSHFEAPVHRGFVTGRHSSRS